MHACYICENTYIYINNSYTVNIILSQLREAQNGPIARSLLTTLAIWKVRGLKNGGLRIERTKHNSHDEVTQMTFTFHRTSVNILPFHTLTVCTLFPNVEQWLNLLKHTLHSLFCFSLSLSNSISPCQRLTFVF